MGGKGVVKGDLDGLGVSEAYVAEIRTPANLTRVCVMFTGFRTPKRFHGRLRHRVGWQKMSEHPGPDV